MLRSSFQFLKNSSQMLGPRHLTRTLCIASSPPTYETLAVTYPKPFVAHVQFNRPDRYNAMNRTMWIEMGQCFNSLSTEPDCRVIVLSANGKHFNAGIDLVDMLQVGQALGDIEDVYRKGQYLENGIKLYQDCVTSIESCAKPVIACIHSACVGAGVDIITASDMRFCSKDAWFTVKEVDIGMPADVGTLQRLPRVIGNQTLVRELCYTGRKFLSDEALSSGLVGKVFETKETLLEYAVGLAEVIAQKSPVAVQAIKKNLNFSQEHKVQEGLDQIREINKLLLQGEDFVNAVIAAQSKGEVPVFSKL